MLERMMYKGAEDACARLKLAAGEAGMLGGLLGKAKSFGSGQLAAGKDLIGNLRAGFGGASPHATLEGPVPDASWHRQQALGNLKTLAPSLLAGGGLYMMHRHNQQQQQEEEARRRAMMAQGYGQPMM